MKPVIGTRLEVFGLPSTIRTCDLGLRRLCGRYKAYIFQLFTALKWRCVINFAMIFVGKPTYSRVHLRVACILSFGSGKTSRNK